MIFYFSIHKLLKGLFLFNIFIKQKQKVYASMYFCMNYQRIIMVGNFWIFFFKLSVDVQLTNMAEMGHRLTGVNSNYRLSTLSTIWHKEIVFDVPAKLHFVWIGKEIPNNYLDNIISFQKYNMQYEVIWAMKSLSCHLYLIDICVDRLFFFWKDQKFRSKSHCKAYWQVYNISNL